MTELIARTKAEALSYANRTWEALRDLQAVDNLNKNDFHFIDMDEDDCVVIAVAHNADNKVWFDARYCNGTLQSISEYDGNEIYMGEIYDSKYDC